MIRSVIRRTLLYDAYIIGRASALRRWGWFRSLRERRPVDAGGRPLPWYTYPCIHFLEPRVRPDFDVFEFGSGYSTLWWASRVRRVVAVEHDPAWYRSLQGRLPSNASVVCRRLRDGSYTREITCGGTRYDIVVIDGRLRNWCAEIGTQHLTPSGVMIFDNSDRTQYRRGLRFLGDVGFRRLDFVGLVPGLDIESMTSVFYRTENCLGL